VLPANALHLCIVVSVCVCVREKDRACVRECMCGKEGKVCMCVHVREWEKKLLAHALHCISVV